MTVLLADIDIGIFPFIVKAAVVMTMLGGFALLAFIAILAAVKRRSGIAAFAGGLLTLGLLLSAGLGLSWVSMRSDRAFDLSPHSINSELPIHWAGWDPAEFRQVPVWPRLGLLLMIGAAIVVFAGMWRRNPSSEEPHTRRSWWPVLLVPALLVVAAPLFYMQFGVHRSMSYAPLHAPPQPPVPLVHYSRDEAVMPQKAAQLEAELHRQIAEMDIHELMDLFDAPRIVITMPRKITLPILSNLPKPISLPVKSVTILLAAAESAEDSDSLAGDDQQREADLVEGQSDNRLIAEADAAIETVAEEAEDAWSDSSKSGAKSEHVAEVKSSNAEVESIKEAERKRENNDEAELSTPIAASPQPKIEQPPPPKWISSPPLRIDEVRREVFVTDEWYTEQECERARDIGLMHKIYERIQWLNGDSYGDEFVDNVRLLEAAGDDQKIRDLQSAGITVPFIHQEIIKDQYFATVERSFAPMKKLYTLIEFNPNIDRQLRQYWDSHQRKERFAVVGAGASGILGLLGLCYGLLKVDTWTKGYYTKRLFLGVPAAIIGAGTLLAAMIFG